jgi:hypothetical protein
MVEFEKGEIYVTFNAIVKKKLSSIMQQLFVHCSWIGTHLYLSFTLAGLSNLKETIDLFYSQKNHQSWVFGYCLKLKLWFSKMIWNIGKGSKKYLWYEQNKQM